MAIVERSGARRTLSSKVVEILRREIEDGDYAVGDKLPAEPVLVERFGFSRTVIREAIAALRADGLVESRHGVGVFVLGPRQAPESLELFTQATDKISDIIEELELRIGIEVEAAGLAALRSSPAQEAEIQSRLEAFADLVAADLYAATALWRFPELTTTVLRLCYTLGPAGGGTLATFLRGPRVPYVLGFDPLFQFMHERDVVSAICLAVQKRIRGVYNVSGPQPVPLTVVVRETGRTPMPLPQFMFAAALGRFGLPRLPRGALDHIKYPIVIDGAAFRAATGFSHEYDEVRTLHDFKDACPVEEKQSKLTATVA